MKLLNDLNRKGYNNLLFPFGGIHSGIGDFRGKSELSINRILRVIPKLLLWEFAKFDEDTT
jgi:hypothetical protein